MGAWLRRHATAVFFILAFGASGTALAILGLPRLDASAPTPTAALFLFPAMVGAVALAGVALTAMTGGRAALRAMVAAESPRRVSLLRFSVVLVPPAAVLLVLLGFSSVVSPAFAPSLFPTGIAFGLTAGLLEEIGWTGFAYPRLRNALGPTAGALILGLLWGVWHLPVSGALGAASPHGHAWPAFFVSFVAALCALRVLICAVVDRTHSLLLAQLLHASSTAALVTLGPMHVTGFQEALWYAAYAVALWIPAAWVLLNRTSRVGRFSATAATPST